MQSHEEVFDAVPLNPRKTKIALRASDRLVADLQIDHEDVEDIAKSVAKRAGYDFTDITANPFAGNVYTVGELVMFFMHQRAAETLVVFPRSQTPFGNALVSATPLLSRNDRLLNSPGNGLGRRLHRRAAVAGTLDAQAVEETGRQFARAHGEVVPLVTERAQARAVVEPRGTLRGVEQRLELQRPESSLERKITAPPHAQPIEMKRDVPRLVAQHQPNRLAHRAVLRADVDHFVIGGADDLRGEQHLDLEAERPGAAREL